MEQTNVGTSNEDSFIRIMIESGGILCKITPPLLLIFLATACLGVANETWDMRSSFLLPVLSEGVGLASKTLLYCLVILLAGRRWMVAQPLGANKTISRFLICFIFVALLIIGRRIGREVLLPLAIYAVYRWHLNVDVDSNLTLLLILIAMLPFLINRILTLHIYLFENFGMWRGMSISAWLMKERSPRVFSRGRTKIAVLVAATAGAVYLIRTAALRIAIWGIGSELIFKHEFSFFSFKLPLDSRILYEISVIEHLLILWIYAYACVVLAGFYAKLVQEPGSLTAPIARG